MDLKNNLETLKQIIIEKNLTNVQDEIDTKDVEKAYVNVKCMALETTDDYFLFFSSLNLLNSYVKKDYSTSKDYDFKKEVSKGLESLASWQPKGVKFSYNKEVAIIDIEGLQFSFHNAEITNLLERKMYRNKPIEWNGIRLQPVANTVFSFADQLNGLSNKTLFGKTLNELYEEMNLESFNNNSVKR